jgi:hypothetical protein
MNARIFIILVLLMDLVISCSCSNRGPEAKISIKVVDEYSKTIDDAVINVGFLSNNDKNKELSLSGKTNTEGLFSAEGKTNGLVGATISKNGYYNSTVDYPFTKKNGDRWEPWNPVATVILRKIEKPIPMYARRFDKVLPLKDKDIGCDLIANDWVKPYGKGVHSDFVFHMNKKYTNNDDYSADLHVKFSETNDGYVKYDLKMYNGSEFKLPRFAPLDGYQKHFVRHVIKQPGKAIIDDRDDNVGYVFRVRSSGANNSQYAVYGKIQRDFEVRAMGEGTAGVAFTYYLNPDHTRNLEFDPKRNLFKDLKSFDQVGL